MEINFQLKSEKGFDETLGALAENLQKEGFGILWEFDVPEKLKEKGFTFETRCRILEICNPAKAKEALETSMNAVFFLPCKIVVFEQEGAVFMGMIRPSLMMELLEDQAIMPLAHEVERHLKRAILESV